jgi:hypothetical protein
VTRYVGGTRPPRRMQPVHPGDLPSFTTN